MILRVALALVLVAIPAEAFHVRGHYGTPPMVQPAPIPPPPRWRDAPRPVLPGDSLLQEAPYGPRPGRSLLEPDPPRRRVWPATGPGRSLGEAER